jgi:hypothetical protein
MPEQLNYEVENPEIKDIMRDIGGKIGGALPPKWGFMLMIFDESSEDNPTKSVANPGADSAMFYISSHERSSVIKMMQEWIRRQKP